MTDGASLSQASRPRTGKVSENSHGAGAAAPDADEIFINAGAFFFVHEAQTPEAGAKSIDPCCYFQQRRCNFQQRHTYLGRSWSVRTPVLLKISSTLDAFFINGAAIFINAAPIWAAIGVLLLRRRVF